MDVLDDTLPEESIPGLLIEFFIVKPKITLYDFIKTQEENMCRTEYTTLDAIITARNVATSDLMKVKWIFFYWIVNSEEGYIFTEENDTEDIPDTWTNDAVLSYQVKHTEKYYDVLFGVCRDYIMITISRPDKPENNVARPVKGIPRFGLPNQQKKPDRKLYRGIVASFTVHFRSFMLYTAVGKNVKKRSHGSGSTCSIPGYPND